MSKTGRNIYKRKDGRWEGRFAKGRNANGKLIYVSVYAKTYAEAKRKLDSLSTDKTPMSPVSAIPKKQALTFAEIASRWLPIIALKVKPSTHARYATLLKSHILPTLGKAKMTNLATPEIGSFAKAKLENGRMDKKGGLSAKTVCDMLSVVKSIVAFAHGENIIGENFEIVYPKKQRRSMRVLSRQEQSSLEAVLLFEPDICKIGMLLCLYTGLRIGELCALRWQDISAGFDTLSVCQTLQRIKNMDNVDKTEKEGGKTKIIIDSPKSLRSAREIPIPKFMSPYLQEFSRTNQAYFLATDEMSVTEPRTMQNHFARITRAANIDDANYHSLRHTFATRCIEAGMDIKSLSEMLGHASAGITLGCYVHSSFEQKREGIDKLERHCGMQNQ